MKKKFNTLQKYIFDYSVKDYAKETVNSLFRTVLEPLTSNQNFESFILIKIENTEGKESFIKRLEFSGAKLISFNDKLQKFNIDNASIQNIWGESEFIIVIGGRYSSALIWDYELSGNTNKTPMCLFYNSSIITDIAKKIQENCKIDYKPLLQKYVPDRRENTILNKAINNIVNELDERNLEIIFKEAEGNNLLDSDETIKTAEAVTTKAKFVAHEIKNNLSIINIYSTITKKRLEKIEFEEETSTSINNALKNIEKASEQISTLISDLRCISKPYISEFNIKDIINKTVTLCEEKLKREKVNIILNEIEDISIKADKTKIECALMNIIFNAIEAKKAKSEIRISLKENKDYISIYVGNNGKAIEKENIQKIFTPEFTTKETGNGIGLAYCKKQLNETGSDIKLIKSDEKETIFEIIIKKN